MMKRYLPPIATSLLTLAFGLTFGLAGCVGAPEHCRGCLNGLAPDGGGFEPPTIDGSGTGGNIVATGGSSGTGGVIGAGGAGTGGRIGGGTGGGTGGRGTGGASSGGSGTGGSNSTGGSIGTGGSGTGGASSGGSGTGGSGTGGMGTGGMGTGGSASGGAGGATDPDLVLWYKFDESAGTTVVDSAVFGGTTRNGSLTTAGSGTAAFATTHQVGTHSANLTSSSANNGGFVTSLPSPGLQTLAPTAVTIACWVFVRTNQIWQRAFDFGANSTSSYMFLSTNQAMTNPNSPRFAITTAGNASEQIINMTTPATLSLNTWHHLAVVLPDTGGTYTGTLYIDGAVAGTNNAMTLHPGSLGATANNFLGKSQFNDPYFNGQLDDFRVYRRALTQAEITALFAVR